VDRIKGPAEYADSSHLSLLAVVLVLLYTVFSPAQNTSPAGKHQTKTLGPARVIQFYSRFFRVSGQLAPAARPVPGVGAEVAAAAPGGQLAGLHDAKGSGKGLDGLYRQNALHEIMFLLGALKHHHECTTAKR
jgi:hypothetical protein